MSDLTCFTQPHDVSFDANGVDDLATIALMRDAIAVEASSYRGDTMGPWLEARMRTIIKGWLPTWCTSYAQIADPDNPSVQSCAIDLIIHKPVPSEFGYPPPASVGENYPLVPRKYCCAIVDTKYTILNVNKYFAKEARGLEKSTGVRQMDFLKGIPFAIFALRSAAKPVTLHQQAIPYGIHVFVMGKVITQAKKLYRYQLHQPQDGVLPLDHFKQFLLNAAAAWEHEQGRNI